MAKKIWELFGTFKRQAILAPVFVTIETILEVLIPFLMTNIINVGVYNGDLNYIARTGLLMVLMACFALFFGAMSSRIAATAGAGLAKNIRSTLFEKVQKFSFSNADKFSTASLVTRMTTDVTNTQMSVMMVLRMAVRSPVMLISAMIMAIQINAELSTVFLVALPILVLALVVLLRFAHPRFQKMLKEYDKMNATVQENLVGMRVVKAFVREDHETDKFRSSADRVFKAQLKAEYITVYIMPVMQFVMYGCMIAVCYFGGLRIIGADMLAGDLMGFITYTSQILISLMMFGMVFIMMMVSRASRQRIMEVLDEEVDIKEIESGAKDTVKDGSVRFDNVSFRYQKTSEHPTLNGIDFEISSGETIGIIGGTGSGKTSLVQLIARLYDVDGGRVLVGGVDVREYKLQSLRDEVAMVLQKNVLFSGTIKENLMWGNENATDSEIHEAAKAAAAHDFIMSFPDGYETNLGQGGVNVSGGQKQRLCIARALLKKPKVMILDDSTSAVDTATDAKIRRELKEKLSGMTTIIIAQRIASVMDADRIIVLDAGRVADIGDHAYLMQSSDIYKEVYESQVKGGGDDE